MVGHIPLVLKLKDIINSLYLHVLKAPPIMFEFKLKVKTFLSFIFFLFLIFNFLGFGPFDKTAIACLHVCHEPIGLGWSFSWGKAMGWTTEVSHGRRVWVGACPLFCNFLFAFYPFHFFFQKFGPRPSYKSSHHNQSVDFILIWHSLSLLQATELEIFI